jgi:toxin ParE1/3/4
MVGTTANRATAETTTAMSYSISIRPQAMADLNKHADYLTQQDAALAFRFFDAARQTFADLARMPEMGKLYTSPSIRLQNLRRWQIKGFKRYLIFYLVQDQAIEIVRILYGTQDIQTILGKES